MKKININKSISKELKEAILGGQKLIDNKLKGEDWFFRKRFEHYMQTYFSTNEKIGSYLDIYDISNKENALAVTASGDHAFNLITKGILDIDTFDINKLTEYYAFGLKRAMIIKYSYEEYLDVLFQLLNRETSLDIITTIIFDLLPYMDEKYRIFWKEMIEYNYNIQRNYSASTLNLMYILCMGHINDSLIISNNNYLRDKEAYNKLKENIGKANITFTYADAENLSETFKDKKYDLVLLSNILDYFSKKWGYNWGYNKLEKYSDDLKSIVKENGIIFLFYLFIYEVCYSNGEVTKVDYIMRLSNVSLDDLKGMEMHSLKSQYDIKTSGILLKKC